MKTIRCLEISKKNANGEFPRKIIPWLVHLSNRWQAAFTAWWTAPNCPTCWAWVEPVKSTSPPIKWLTSPPTGLSHPRPTVGSHPTTTSRSKPIQRAKCDSNSPLLEGNLSVLFPQCGTFLSNATWKESSNHALDRWLCHYKSITERGYYLFIF